MRINTKKMAASAMLAALTAALSGFAVPVGASKCFPVQHLANVIAAVLLGPAYGVIAAFSASLIRNLMGTGSLLAFPGSMVGALLAGYLCRHTGKLTAAYAGEVFGTGILGAILCYPVASMLMGKEAAIFTYVVPFLMSTGCGTAMAAVLLGAMRQAGAMNLLRQMMES